MKKTLNSIYLTAAKALLVDGDNELWLDRIHLMQIEGTSAPSCYSDYNGCREIVLSTKIINRVCNQVVIEATFAKTINKAGVEFTPSLIESVRELSQKTLASLILDNEATSLLGKKMQVIGKIYTASDLLPGAKNIILEMGRFALSDLTDLKNSSSLNMEHVS